MLHVPRTSLRLRRCLFVLALVAAYPWSAGLAAGGKPAQKVEGWGELADPGGQCKVRKDGGRVTLEVPAGSFDLYPDNPGHAPRSPGRLRYFACSGEVVGKAGR